MSNIIELKAIKELVECEKKCPIKRVCPEYKKLSWKYKTANSADCPLVKVISKGY